MMVKLNQTYTGTIRQEITIEKAGNRGTPFIQPIPKVVVSYRLSQKVTFLYKVEPENWFHGKTCEG